MESHPNVEERDVRMGHPATYVNGASLTTTNFYDSRLQPCRLSARSSGSAPTQCTDTNVGNILDLKYDFHPGSGDNGNVYRIINNRDGNRTQNFTYDSLNRIQTSYANGPGGPNWGEDFTIDAWGNLTNRALHPGKSISEPLSAPALVNNQLTGFGYDAAGNLTSNGGSSYTYDQENRMSTFVGGTTTNYSYDGDGRRVKKTGPVALYWYSATGDVLDETSSTGALTSEHVFFNGQRVARRDANNGVHYYFSDHLGSHGVVTSSSGVCEQDIDYYPYGGTVQDFCPNVAQHYKFTGKERDSESTLDNFEARYFGSSMGRFMSQDPEQIDGFDHMGDPQSWNGYAYVHNNPLNATDPDGLDCIYSKGDGTGYVQRGDCTNAGGKDDDGLFVNGKIDVKSFKYNADNNSSSFNYTTDSGGIGKGVLQGPDLNSGFPSGSLAADVFGSANASTWNNAAGGATFLFNLEKNTIGFFFPITNLVVDQVAGAGSSGTSAAGISRKPGSLGPGKGTDALRRENKVARDIMKKLGLGEEYGDLVHDELAAGAQLAGRKLTFKEGVAAVKAALGLL